MEAYYLSDYLSHQMYGIEKHRVRFIVKITDIQLRCVEMQHKSMTKRINLPCNFIQT